MSVQGEAVIPSHARSRQLRACLLCSIVQTPGDFKKVGCPNCEEILQVPSTAYSPCPVLMIDVPS
jgi:transcription elongation factor SPT4